MVLRVLVFSAVVVGILVAVAGSGVNSAFAEGRFADTGVDGAGRLAGGLGASRDACGRVGST